MHLHRAWLGDLRRARVLDLGCFSGNQLSIWVAENAAEYIGIDLSEQAIAELNQQLALKKLPHARALRMDFLANDWPDGHFDVVYAYSVLHHFADLDVALAELHRILKPGGIVVTMDALATDPLNRLARTIYRPVQSDRDWEFPFERGTFTLIRRYFLIERLQGIQGVVRLAYPFLLFSGTERFGRRLAKRLLALDAANARSLGMPFFLCWWAAMKLRPADGTSTATTAVRDVP